jgi:ribosomal protein L7/L12
VAAQRWELEARILKQAGKLIDAIKVVREATGWGLKESKDFVDRM